MPALRRHAFWLILAGAALVLFAHALWYRDYVSDDAYISLRYARRLLEGRGLTYTDGERVEGYSNLSWVLGCALFGRAGIDLVVAARLLGAAGMGAALLAIARASRKNGALATAAACFSFVAAGPVAIWTVGGLEAPLQAAFLAWGVAGVLALTGETRPTAPGALRAGIPLAGLAVTRPDGLVLIFALAITTRRARLAAALLLPSIAATLAQLLFRLVYYRAWLPNTAWAKLGAGAWRSGATYLFDGALGLSGLLLLAIVGVALAPRRRALVIALPAIVWLAYVAWIGGDFMPGHRLLIPLVVLAAFGAGESLAAAARFGRDGALRLRLGAALALVWFALAQFYDPENLFAHAQTWAKEGVALGELFRRAFSDRRPLIALDAAGAIAYASELPSLDMLGLCDAHIAHHPPPRLARDLPGHALGDGHYVLDRQPDLVVFNGPEGGEPMFTGGRQMRSDPRFADYEPITFATGALRSSAFVRRDGRAGIQANAIPGWLFANAEGNVARLDESGHLEGELRAPSTLAPSTLASARAIVAVDPPDAAVSIERRADGALLVRPTKDVAHLRAIFIR
jgi:arabinofuranosyltransferase